MDLMDAIRNPQPGSTSFPIGMGMRMPGLGMGPGGGGYGSGQFQFGGGQPGGGMGGFPHAPPPQSHDIFSMPADPLLDSNFSQPLLPTNTVGGAGGVAGGAGGQPQAGGGGKKVDAFSDLVSMARTKTTKPEPAPPTSVEVPPPLPPRSPELDFTDAPPLPVSSGLSSAAKTGPGMFDDSFGMSALPTAGSGFGSTDMFGDSFTSGQAAPQPPPPGDSSWISF